MDERFQRLREARIAAGLETAAAAADTYGWNRNTYASNENGNATFSYRRAKEYAAAFGVRPEWLYDATGPIRPMAAEGFVPVSVVQELRNELKALKQPPVTRVDPNEDPEGALYQSNFSWSQRLAVATHGEDLVNTAVEWARQRADRSSRRARFLLSCADSTASTW